MNSNFRHGQARTSEQSAFVHQWFEAQAALTPEAMAVECAGASLSYAELNQRANRLARRLRRLGVKPNTPVLVCLERSLDLVVTIYGVLKAGGAYVTIDPAYPDAGIIGMIESIDARFAVCSPQKTALFQEKIENLVEPPVAAAGSEAIENLPLVNSPDDLIYIIFTSGSTGRAKGAGVYHRGFANLLNWFIDEFGIGPRDRTLVVSSSSFDLTQKNYFAVPARGGELHLAAPGAFDPDALARKIEAARITLLNCTPSAAYPLAELRMDEQLPRLASLRCLFLGGEPISAHRFRGWAGSPFFHAEIVNTYGPTECTDICAFHRLTAAELSEGLPVPLGRPIDNVSIAVVDENFEECAPGETGELWIGGAGIGAGYVNGAALNVEKFIANPVPALLPGTTVYRTGDMARRRNDGALEFAGRLDHQIKIRGFRVEIGEVEAVLERHPEIRQSAVVARRVEGSPGSLGACFVSRSGGAVSSDSLRDFLRRHLPEHMTPATFIQVDRLPLSPNGKVDRKKLVEECDRRAGAAAEAPRTLDIESRVEQAWCEVLHLPEAAHDRNFFDLGGDSLLLVDVHSRLRQFLPAGQASITALLQYPTIASFARSLTAPAPASDVAERAGKQRAAMARGGAR